MPRRGSWVLFFLLVSFMVAQSTLLARPAAAAEVGELVLSAESIEHSVEAGLLDATGGVDVTVDQWQAQGDRLTANLKTHVLHLTGPVTLKTTSGELTGDSLDYAWDRKEGSLTNADTVVSGVRLSAGSAGLNKQGWVLEDGLFTKCLLPQPEYAFEAKRIQVDPATNVAYIEGVTLAFYGRRILPLPNLRISLSDTKLGEESRRRLPVPQVGFDSKRGYFISDELPVYLAADELTLVGAGFGTREGIRLGVSGLYTPSESTELRYDVRAVQKSPAGASFSPDGTPDVDGTVALKQSSRVGQFVLAYSDEDDDYAKDLGFLPQIQWKSNTLRLGAVQLNGTTEWARIQEKRSGAATTRSQGTLNASAGTTLAGRFRLGANTSLRGAFYGSGTQVLAASASGQMSVQLTQGLSGQVKYSVADFQGVTPFRFDAPDRLREGAVGLAWRDAQTTVSGGVVYDLDAKEGAGTPSAVTAAFETASSPWRVGVNARYELTGQPHYSTLTISLTRELHCWDLQLKADQADKSFSVGAVLR